MKCMLRSLPAAARPLIRTITMAKRPNSSASSTSSPTSSKRAKMSNSTFKPNKVASAEAAAAVDRDPPLQKLLEAVKKGVSKPAKGECVVYWMRLEDLRSMFNQYKESRLFS
jgi:deoxyribodipyrimidine photo-lyase